MNDILVNKKVVKGLKKGMKVSKKINTKPSSKDSERRKQKNPIHVKSIMMDRLLERLNCSYGSSVESLRYLKPSQLDSESILSSDGGSIELTDSSFISSNFTDSLISGISGSSKVLNEPENNHITDGLTDSSIVGAISPPILS